MRRASSPIVALSRLPEARDQTRTSADRWRRLSVLLAMIERGVEASARLDAYGPRGGAGRPSLIGKHHHGLARFNDRLTVLEARIDHELDRLTAERLIGDLARRQQAHAA